jgi:Xaa-Pro aminopeptidase
MGPVSLPEWSDDTSGCPGYIRELNLAEAEVSLRSFKQMRGPALADGAGRDQPMGDRWGAGPSVSCTRRGFGFSLLSACVSASFGQVANSPYRKRRGSLAEKTRGGAVLLFTGIQPDDDRLQYRPDSNFYYLTGWRKPGAALLIASGHPASGVLAARSYEEILFLPEPNPWGEHLTGPMLSARDPAAPAIADVDRVESLSALDEEVQRLTVGSNGLYVMHPSGGLDAVQSAWRGRRMDLEPALKSMRMVKDQQEMVLIRTAVDASVAGHLAAMKAVKPGRHEYEIAALMQYELQTRGCERLAYPAIVASGIHSAYAHHDADSTLVGDGDLILMDVGGECSMYAADITRTIPANGRFTPRQRQYYEVVLGAQAAAERAFRVGESTLWGTTNSLHDIARAYIDSHGSDVKGRSLGKYFQGGLGKLGHHVGLDVHDLADYNVPLREGNVFTLEPGVYLPEEKLGIRIEDMYWVDPAGKLVKLTSSLPSAPDDVERTMRSKL